MSDTPETPNNKDEANADAGDDWAAAMAEQSDVEAAEKATATEASTATEETSDAETTASSDKEDVERAEFQNLNDNSAALGSIETNMEVILDIPVTLSMEIGRTEISIQNLLQLNQGSVVELDRLAGEPMDVLVNGILIAHGEVVVVNEKFGIRLTDVISPAERVKKLR